MLVSYLEPGILYCTVKCSESIHIYRETSTVQFTNNKGFSFESQNACTSMGMARKHVDFRLRFYIFLRVYDLLQL